MTIRHLISALEERLILSLHRFPQDVEGVALILPKPIHIAKRASAIAMLFDEGKPAEPPSQARINALDRLRQGKVGLTRTDWNLISWGLCDYCGRSGLPIETDSMFEKIMQFVHEENIKGISRKIWFGLLHSYFAYSLEKPENNKNWRTLQATLAASLPILIQNQSRPKAWARALAKQSQLFTENAGVDLGKALFYGDKVIADEVATFLPIPESSWLWRKIIGKQLQMLFEIEDDEYHSSIPTMLSLGLQHPRQTDDILIALLTRYEKSSFRDNPHKELKQFALDQWQNPQMKSANRWSGVSDDVRKMMLHWFAKADLEHFFSLLQGEGGVDRARLHYWLRFVGQISFTRIVMGWDAFINKHPDFTDFRTKNKGRFSQLTDGPTSNNAFIMRIGDYYFVEFSGTGNACYIYAENKLPFDPEVKSFRLYGLKNKSNAEDRITHIGDWAWKADRLLARLGIFPGVVIKNNRQHYVPPVSVASTIPTAPMMKNQGLSNHTNQPARLFSVPNATNQSDSTEQSASTLPSHAPIKKTKIDLAVEAAIEMSMDFNLSIEDHRIKGGAFWVLEKNLDTEMRIKLDKLGFDRVIKRGYWIK
jgi:hypothetical protein